MKPIENLKQELYVRMHKRNELILASASPRRQELIRLLGLPYRIDPADVDERIEGKVSPHEAVEILSLRKAKAVAGRLESDAQGAIVVGSDTIVVLDGELLGKPDSAEEAWRMLEMLQGRTHEVYSGIACVLVDCGETAAAIPAEKSDAETLKFGDTGRYRVRSSSTDGKPVAIVGHTVTKVTFRPMDDLEIEAYVRSGEPMDKAGSYGVQGSGAIFIEKIEGDFYSVMGLPVNLLYRMLLMFDVSPFEIKR